MRNGCGQVEAGELEAVAMGLLADRARLDIVCTHVGDCRACQRALEQLSDAHDALLVATVPTRLHANLMAVLEGTARFEPVLKPLAALLECDVTAAHRVVERLLEPSGWSTQFRGVRVKPVSVHPAGRVALALWVEPGACVPLHQHDTLERSLVLEGGYLASDSRAECWRGELDVRAVGTQHVVTALGPIPCLAIVVS